MSEEFIRLEARLDILLEMFNHFFLRDKGVAIMWWDDYEKLVEAEDPPTEE